MGEVIANQGELAGLCGHDGTSWEKAKINASKQLEVEVKAQVGPTGYALDGTVSEISARIGEPGEAAAGTVIKILDDCQTALEKIDDLRGALDSVGTDELDVNIEDSITLTIQAAGGDKPLSLESLIVERVINASASAGQNTLVGTAVTAGKIWVVTAISVRNATSGCGPILIYFIRGGTSYDFRGIATLTADLAEGILTNVYLGAGDILRARFDACTAGDTIVLDYSGYQMDAP